MSERSPAEVVAAQGAVARVGNLAKHSAVLAGAEAALLEGAIEKAPEETASPVLPLASGKSGQAPNLAIASGRPTEFSSLAFVQLNAEPQAAAPASGSLPSAQFGKTGEARSGEAPLLVQPASNGSDLSKPAMPKLAFAEWIQDFAAAHGATHRSGDLVGSLDRAVNGLATPHAGQDALRPTPLQMLPIEMGMQALRGVTKFQIRLDPAELGRVDVKLEIREDGEVKASLVVDRVETLAMLKRDAQTLQQAFEQAGLRHSPDGLNFSLRGESQNQQNGQRQSEGGRESAWKDDGVPSNELPPELVMRRVMIPNSSLDLII
jgi:flagellar hook-length control protein FliK